jgi:hypothetical protein
MVAGATSPGLAPAAAEPGRVAVDPTDLPIVITGRLGQTEYWKAIRLRTTGPTIRAVAYLATALTATDDTEVVIPRLNVKLQGVTRLSSDDAVDARIVVTDAPRAGTYVGRITIYARGHLAKGREYPLTVVISERPIATERIQVEPVPIKIEGRIGQEATFSTTVC